MNTRAKCRYPLHYVGQATYNLKSFIAEARRLGVARAIPKNIARKLDFGDIILLAIYKPYKKKGRRIGQAYVFGYFIIEGVNADHEVLEEAKKYLKVREHVSYVQVVVRGCGTYTVCGAYVVDNRLCEVIGAIERAELKLKKTTKVFLTGRFVEIEPIVIEGMSFTRSIVYVELPCDSIVPKSRAVAEGKPRVVKIKDYVRIKRRTKKEKEATLHRPLEEFMRVQ